MSLFFFIAYYSAELISRVDPACKNKLKLKRAKHGKSCFLDLFSAVFYNFSHLALVEKII